MADQTKKEIALVIWVNDIPIRGGVLKLSDITSPRREFEEYRQGETVLARCRGFKGNHECVLARIGGKEMKEVFQDLLVGSSFIQLLDEFQLQVVPSQKPGSTCTSTDADNNREETSLPIRSVSKQPSHTKEKRKNSSPKKRNNDSHLLQVASDLELTELESTAVSQQSAFQVYCRQTPVKKSCVGSVVRGGLLALEHDISNNDTGSLPIADKPDSKSCACGCQAEIDRLSKECQRFEQEFMSLWYWINMIYSMVNPTQKVMGTPTSSSQMQFQHDSSLQKPSTSSMQQLSSPEQWRGENLEETNQHPGTSLSSPGLPFSASPCTFGGYTKAQLEREIAGFGKADYAKAAKLLFRRLYTEEEYLGRTLTGTRANNQYEGRPALEDQSKMIIIYEILKEKFGVTAVQVREKLRDILKPSKAKQKPTK